MSKVQIFVEEIADQKFLQDLIEDIRNAYLEAILGESKSQKEQLKEIKRDYRNTAHWVLDPQQMTILQPLKLFLDNYFL